MSMLFSSTTLVDSSTTSVEPMFFHSTVNKIDTSLSEKMNDDNKAFAEIVASVSYEMEKRATNLTYGLGFATCSLLEKSDNKLIDTKDAVDTPWVAQTAKIYDFIKNSPMKIFQAIFQSGQKEENIIKTLEDGSKSVVLNSPLGQVRTFRIGAELARGGNNVINYAFDDITGEKVALKIDNEFTLIDEKTLEKRARDEAREIATLRHFGWLYGYGTVRGNDGYLKKYLAVPLLEGTSLDKHLRKLETIISSTKNKEELKGYFNHLFEIAVRFCTSVQQFHDEGLLHRDVKPENMMVVEKENKVKLTLIDFGGVTNEVDMVNDIDPDYGTKCYMAPELPHLKHSRSTDAYSVGKSLEKILDLLSAPQLNKIKMKESKYKDAFDNLSEVIKGLTTINPLERMKLPKALSILEEHLTKIFPSFDEQQKKETERNKV